MFKHTLGYKAKSKSTLLEGVLMSRSENLFGCNRYYLQPHQRDGKVPEGMWFDEDDLELEFVVVEVAPKSTGGPPSKIV